MIDACELLPALPSARVPVMRRPAESREARPIRRARRSRGMWTGGARLCPGLHNRGGGSPVHAAMFPGSQPSAVRLHNAQETRSISGSGPRANALAGFQKRSSFIDRVDLRSFETTTSWRAFPSPLPVDRPGPPRVRGSTRGTAQGSLAQPGFTVTGRARHRSRRTRSPATLPDDPEVDLRATPPTCRRLFAGRLGVSFWSSPSSRVNLTAGGRWFRGVNLDARAGRPEIWRDRRWNVSPICGRRPGSAS